MAREWTLEETRALVEAHIELKQHERPIPQGSNSRAVSDSHWDKVAKKLRDRGYHRSFKSCNKRWYRLEQYEVQIFSFNIEEAGNHGPNYWELTRAERYEHRGNKWPQLPLGEGIDKEIFDLIKRFSRGCVEKKVITQSTAPILGLNNTRHAALPESMVVAPHQVVLEEAKEPKNLEGNSCWSSLIAHQTVVPSQDPLDGFKLQARELRKQRATELRRGNRTVPYNANHITFVKACQAPQVISQAPNIGKTIPQQKKSSTPVAESAKSSSAVPTSELTDLGSKTKASVQSSSGTSAAHQVQKEKTNSPSFDSAPFSYKLEMDLLPQPAHIHLSSQLSHSEVPHVTPLPLQPATDKPTTHQTSNSSTTNFPVVLQSINSHLPSLQPTDNNNMQQPQHHQHLATMMTDHNLQHSMLNGDNLLPPELLELSFQEQLEVLLSVHNHDAVPRQNKREQSHHPEVMQQTWQCWQAPPGSQQWRDQYGSAGGHGSSHHHRIQGVAIGNLEMQLHALVNLLQARNSAEQQYQDKMLLSFESMAISLHTIAQGNV